MGSADRPLRGHAPKQLHDCLTHLLKAADNANLLTPSLLTTLCEHAAGHLRLLLNLAQLSEPDLVCHDHRRDQLTLHSHDPLVSLPLPIGPRGNRNEKRSLGASGG